MIKSSRPFRNNKFSGFDFALYMEDLFPTDIPEPGGYQITAFAKVPYTVESRLGESGPIKDKGIRLLLNGKRRVCRPVYDGGHLKTFLQR